MTKNSIDKTFYEFLLTNILFSIHEETFFELKMIALFLYIVIYLILLEEIYKVESYIFQTNYFEYKAIYRKNINSNIITFLKYAIYISICYVCKEFIMIKHIT